MKEGGGGWRKAPEKPFWVVCALDKWPSSAPQSNYNSKIDLLELLLIYLDLIKHARRTHSSGAYKGGKVEHE